MQKMATEVQPTHCYCGQRHVSSRDKGENDRCYHSQSLFPWNPRRWKTRTDKPPGWITHITPPHHYVHCFAPLEKRGKISLVLCHFHFFFHPKSCAVLLYWITTQTWPYCSRLHAPHGNCKKINSVLSETRTTRHHGFAKRSCLPSLITCDEMSDLAEMGAPADIPHLTTSTSSVFLTLSPIKSSLRCCWSMG